MMILENSLGENKRIDHVYKNYALNTIIIYFLKICIKFRTPLPPCIQLWKEKCFCVMNLMIVLKIRSKNGPSEFSHKLHLVDLWNINMLIKTDLRSTK